MQKSITVKGVGSAQVKPDYVELSLTLKTKDMDYEAAMAAAAEKIQQISDSFTHIGFEKEAVKTTDFYVQTKYGNKKDRNGDYYKVFIGYEVNHRLKIAFDFNTQRLAKALGTVAGCIAQPELSVRFTVREASAVNERLLASACENAKRKAEILCAASGARLGTLLSIEYNWSELDVYSRTRYEIEDDCTCLLAPSSMKIEPDDIAVSDTATFVWEIA